MHIGKENPMNSYYMKIEENSKKLDTCEEEKDLGITFDSNLNFDKHIHNITKKSKPDVRNNKKDIHFHG